MQSQSGVCCYHQLFFPVERVAGRRSSERLLSTSRFGQLCALSANSTTNTWVHAAAFRRQYTNLQRRLLQPTRATLQFSVLCSRQITDIEQMLNYCLIEFTRKMKNAWRIAPVSTVLWVPASSRASLRVPRRDLFLAPFFREADAILENNDLKIL